MTILTPATVAARPGGLSARPGPERPTVRRVVEPLTETAPHAVRRAVFTQHWGDLTLLHWPVDPAVVAPLLPRNGPSHSAGQRRP